MDNKIAIINSSNKDIIRNIQVYFFNKNVVIDIFEDINDPKLIDYNTIVLTSFSKINIPKILKKSNILNIHPALLPAFKCNNALEKSFTSGVKVGGITIHKVTITKFYGPIITQYPVLIGLSTDYNEFKKEIISICHNIYPKVIEKVNNDIVFDFTDLIQTKCHHSCQNCNNC